VAGVYLTVLNASAYTLRRLEPTSMIESTGTLSDIFFVAAYGQNVWGLGTGSRSGNLLQLDSEDVSGITSTVAITTSASASVRIKATADALFVLQHSSSVISGTLATVQARDLNTGAVIWTRSVAEGDVLSSPVNIVTDGTYAYVLNIGSLGGFTLRKASVYKLNLSDGSTSAYYESTLGQSWTAFAKLGTQMFVAEATSNILKIDTGTMTLSATQSVSPSSLGSMSSDDDNLYVAVGATFTKYDSNLTTITTTTFQPTDHLIGQRASGTPSDIYVYDASGGNAQITKRDRTTLALTGNAGPIYVSSSLSSFAVVDNAARGWVVGSVGW